MTVCRSIDVYVPNPTIVCTFFFQYSVLLNAAMTVSSERTSMRVKTCVYARRERCELGDTNQRCLFNREFQNCYSLKSAMTANN